jgi:hypothetical protein
MSTTNEILRPLQRDINSLIDPDRAIRQRGLNNLLNFLSKSYQSMPVEEKTLLLDGLAGPLLTSTSDSIEKCREIAAKCCSL